MKEQERSARANRARGQRVNPVPESSSTGSAKKARGNSSINAARKARLKRKKRKRILKTILLVLLLGCIGLGGFYFVYQYMMGGSLVTLVQPYKASREFVNSITAKEDLRASSFAENLCVVSGNVPLENATLLDNQQGLLFDVQKKKVMYAQNAFQRVYPASITKIMTSILAFQYGHLDETVTITQEDVTLEEGAQVCGFRAGDQVTMDQLIHCLLVYSGNDAAMAIAEHVGGTIEDFVAMMNRYAASLGCTGTHFVNPHGLHDENHYTTPYDIYLILKEALQYPDFSQITQLPEYKVDYSRADGTLMSTRLEATDHYLTGEASPPKDVVIMGGKTGTTSLAGNCLALLSQNAYGRPFVSIVMGASSKEVLYQQMNSLLQNINNV